MTQICSNCRGANADTARFCSFCGYGLPGFPGAMSTTGQLQPSVVLGKRFVIQKKLGQGGMGAVYLAADNRIPGKEWAVKEMDTSRVSSAELAQAKAAFRQEAEMLSRLDHPGLPKVADCFEERGNQYLVMDFIPGQTLGNMMQAHGGPMDEGTVLSWADQLCSVLDYLHRQPTPIIFRDLKPGNIMVTPQGQIKLIDFGIARHFKSGRTKDTVPMGTPGYSPPEQYGTGQTDARSDIYALAATLHQLLTGHDPGITPFNLPPARQVNPNVPRHLELVLQRALQLKPEDRFQTVAEMQQALWQPAYVAAGAGTPVVSTVTAARTHSVPVPSKTSARPLTGKPLPGRLLAWLSIGLLATLGLAYGLPRIISDNRSTPSPSAVVYVTDTTPTSTAAPTTLPVTHPPSSTATAPPERTSISTPTRTATRLPTQTYPPPPTRTQAPVHDVYYDFGTNVGSWKWDLTSQGATVATSNGRLVFQVTQKDTVRQYYMNRDFYDFEVQVDARQVSGDPRSSLGLVFRHRGHRDCYRFTITGSGEFEFGEEVGNDWAYFAGYAGKIRNQCINPAGEWDTLRLVCDGSRLRAYVNGCLVADVTDSTFRYGHVGLLVGTEQSGTSVTVEFDDFILDER